MFLIQALLLLITLLVLWGVTKCLYNVFLHPLRKYPGPLFARATRAYSLLWDVRGLSHWKVKEWHEKYGEVVRIAPDELSYTTSFPNKEGTGDFEKDAQWWNKTVSGVENILTADNTSHRRMRRVQNNALSDRALKAQEPVIAGYVDLLIRRLHEQAGNAATATVDMVAWYNFTTFDIIGDLAFGEPFGCLRDAKWHWWLTAVFEIFQAGTYLRAARRFPPIISHLLILLIPKKLMKTRVDQFNFSAERVKKRLEAETDRPDFMSYILQAGEGRGMTIEETFVAAQVLIVAGSETTATALIGATYFLLENPSTLQKLNEEIRSVFDDEKTITIQSTAGLPYLNAVIEEALRLCPPGPGTFPRTVPKGGRVVRGQYVAGGYSVGVHHLSVNRSSVNFSDSNSFYPERWLDDSRFAGDNKSAMQPFSHGPRNCIGKKAVLSRVVYNFDMTLSPLDRGWLSKQKMYTTWKKTPLRVKLAPVTRK